MATDIPVYIGQDAIGQLLCYCEEYALAKFVLVADQNTYPAMGKAVEAALKGRGADVITVVLTGDEVIADEHYLLQVLFRTDQQDRVFIAVGSGTITDITRFVSFKTRTSFISVPTAPSVDGFTSIGAPLVFDGLKVTFICQAPIAVFADLAVLAAAPRRLVAAGFGDMIAKFMSTADWKLDYILRDQGYDEQITQRSRKAAQACVDHIDDISRGALEGARALMEGCIESGFCMLEFGNTSPASGAEHHLSHFWEMRLLQEHRPSVFHGTKVGIGCVLASRMYEQLLSLSRDQVAQRLAAARLPDRDELIQGIKEAYGSVAQEVIHTQAPLLAMTERDFEQIKQRILDRWDDIRDIAINTPTSQQFTDWLQQVGGPTDGQSIGLSDDEIAQALEYSMYLRQRFTVSTLTHVLGL